MKEIITLEGNEEDVIRIIEDITETIEIYNNQFKCNVKLIKSNDVLKTIEDFESRIGTKDELKYSALFWDKLNNIFNDIKK